MIELENVSKHFNEADNYTKAIEDVSFTVPKHSIVSILGPSGCGKTTLLRMIGGLDVPSTGVIKINNKTPAKSRRKTGIVFQKPALLPWRTVKDNISLFSEVTEETGENEDDLLKLVGLEEFQKHYPWQLSGGMQQRISLARSLSFNPDVLLLDEPFSALDEITKELMTLELLRIKEEKELSIVHVTHNISEAIFLSNKVVLLSKRPSSVDEIFDVKLPSRTFDVKTSLKFNKFEKCVRKKIYSSNMVE
jgi:NitT/TauT family transport system ATP-binding protein